MSTAGSDTVLFTRGKCRQFMLSSHLMLYQTFFFLFIRENLVYKYDFKTNSLSVKFIFNQELIYLRIVKWYQVMLWNINTVILYWYDSILLIFCTQLNGFMYWYLTLIILFNSIHWFHTDLNGFTYSKWSNSSIRFIEETLTRLVYQLKRTLNKAINSNKGVSPFLTVPELLLHHQI